MTSIYFNLFFDNKQQIVQQQAIQRKESNQNTSFKDNRPEAIYQRKMQDMANNSSRVMQLQAMQEMANKGYQSRSIFQRKESKNDNLNFPIQRKENKTGLPDNLKSDIENLSGHSMDDVKVHYNSDKPAQLQAHAYAQGTDIHLGAGQEKHLPHEAWHVVQQKQGRVKPTMQMKGKVNVNDDSSLEREADVMGAKVLQLKSTDIGKQQVITSLNSSVAQLAPFPPVNFSALNIPAAIAHVSNRDHSVKRNRGIGGCHDLNAWNTLRSALSGIPISIGLDPTNVAVPEVLIRGIKGHVVPGVQVISYNIPSLDKTQKTNGNEKKIKDPKTVFDPATWPLATLTQALKEALQDASDKNGGTLPDQWEGVCVAGHKIMGFIRGGTLKTFFFT